MSVFYELDNFIIFFLLVPEAPPTNVKAEAVNSTAIQVWWKPPHPQKINGINQGYKLQAFIGTFLQLVFASFATLQTVILKKLEKIFDFFLEVYTVSTSKVF